jgi:hypothetical protein
VGTGAEVSIEHEELAAGVPRAMSARTKLVGAGVAAAAVAIVLFIALNSVRSRQLQEAEAARSRNVAVVGTTAFARSTAPAAPASPAATTASPAATADIPDPAPVAEADRAGATAGPETAHAPSPGAPPAAGAEVAAPLAAGPAAAPAGKPGETAIDVRTPMHSQSPLVRDAQSALLKGDTVHAMELAQKAVLKEPGDADGWLTLAAARKASGDMSGAAEAYKACIAKAQTVGVMHCRVLGGMH